MIYCDVTGQPVPKPKAYRDGKRIMSLAGDIKAFRQLRSRGEISFLGWLKTLRLTQGYDYFAWHDPVPFLMYILKLFEIRVSRRRAWPKAQS